MLWVGMASWPTKLTDARGPAARRLARPPNNGDVSLGPVSYLDCIVFCIFLAPQLVWQAGLVPTVLCVLQALPFFCK